MFAHVTAGTVDSVGNPPQLVFVDGRWWDLRARDPATLATVGWYPVQEAAKPADTALTTWTPEFTPNGAVVDQSWVEVPKTQEQIDAEADEASRQTIEGALDATLADLDTILGTANGAFTTNTLGAAVKVLARAIRRVIRLLIRRFDGTT